MKERDLPRYLGSIVGRHFDAGDDVDITSFSFQFLEELWIDECIMVGKCNSANIVLGRFTQYFRVGKYATRSGGVTVEDVELRHVYSLRLESCPQEDSRRRDASLS